MKTMLRLSLLLCLLLLADQTFSQSLYIHDPASWSGQQPATIEEASVTIKPKGIYMEYGLYLTISAKGSNYDGNQNALEIVMNFCLPEGSIIHDSWLWVGNDIMQAILIDRGVATQIYEGIVNRRKDPSILTKNANGCYELRVYPLPGNDKRKLKITYLVPARWTRNLVSAPLPLNILQTSHTIPNLNITIHTDATFQNPVVTELGFLPFINHTGNGVYTAMIAASRITRNNTLEFAFSSPLQNGWFACDYPVGSSSGYYQLVFHPQQALQLTKPKKVNILFEYFTSGSIVDENQLFTKTKEMLNEYFLETDSFNLQFVHTGRVQRVSENWLPANDISIQSALSAIPANWISSPSSTSALITNALQFVRDNGNDGEVLLLSNNVGYVSTTWANQMITAVVTGSASAIPVHVLNYGGDNINYYYNNYNSQDYVYQNITAQTGGNYVKHQYTGYQQYWNWEWNYYDYYYKPTTTFGDIMHSIFGSLDAVPENYSLDIEPAYGFTYSEIEVSSLAKSQAMTFIGKYYGNGPLMIEYQGLQDDSILTYQGQLQTYPGDSLTRKMWAGNFIHKMEKSQITNATKRAIIDTSMSNRVLSLFTAFLALEPNDTLQACENCEDDSGGSNGSPTVGVADPKELAASLTAIPNPFSNTVTITISTDAEELKNAELKIFNMMGQEVKVFKGLFVTSQNTITLTWNGEDESGNALPNGVYMAVLVTSSGKQIVKLVKTA